MAVDCYVALYEDREMQMPRMPGATVSGAKRVSDVRTNPETETRTPAAKPMSPAERHLMAATKFHIPDTLSLHRLQKPDHFPVHRFQYLHDRNTYTMIGAKK